MKHSLRPRKPANLPESVHHQLNIHALAASAAGVGMLALTTPAEARIMYTPTHHVIAEGGHYRLDVNHDGITDFTLQAQISPLLKRCSMRFNEQLQVWMQLTLLSRLMLAPTAWAGSKYKVLYAFKGGNDGIGPQGNLVFDTAGNLYGTTTEGGDTTNCYRLGRTAIGNTAASINSMAVRAEGRQAAA